MSRFIYNKKYNTHSFRFTDKADLQKQDGCRWLPFLRQTYFVYTYYDDPLERWSLVYYTNVLLALYRAKFFNKITEP